MKVQNAIKKLEKELGTKVHKQHSGYAIQYKGQEIFFTANFHSAEIEGEKSIATINVRYLGDKDDPMSDYSAGVFFSNISQAIRSVNFRWTQ